jgi:hypothetical protein
MEENVIGGLLECFFMKCLLVSTIMYNIFSLNMYCIFIVTVSA